jgi:hypothetical protein
MYIIYIYIQLYIYVYILFIYIYLLSSFLLFYYYYIDDLCNPVMANLEMVYYCFANITLSSAQGVNALESLGKLFKYANVTLNDPCASGRCRHWFGLFMVHVVKPMPRTHTIPNITLW